MDKYSLQIAIDRSIERKEYYHNIILLQFGGIVQDFIKGKKIIIEYLKYYTIMLLIIIQ